MPLPESLSAAQLDAILYANRKKELPDDPQISESTWRKERRTSYSREFKIRLVKTGITAWCSRSRIAREHNINDNLLFNWKKTV
ncbi:transposase [Escherichia coli]|uniref:transposase n=1 Tax=Escherichia coli TaxID=562 RepID=UPI003EBE7E04